MAKFTITPWRAQADLLQVRQQLYRISTESTDDQRHAVDRVMAWKLRGNLPHAVESTALLVDASLHEHITDNSVFSIRAVYSAAFTRFVTGFCDIGRNRERALEPSSMLEIARQIGMPAEFVALRHEATHEELPSVQRLVNACEQALQWLWQVYWSRLEETRQEAVFADVDQSQCRTEARKIFKEFRSSKRQALKSRTSDARLTEVDRTAATACSKLCKGFDAALQEVARALVEDKVLIPADREVGAGLDGAYLMWDGILLALCKEIKDSFKVIFETMLNALLDQTYEPVVTDSTKDALCQWVQHIIGSRAWRPARGKSRDRPLSTAMQWVCLYPSTWSLKLGRQLLDMGNMEFREDWEEVFKASLAIEMIEPRAIGDDEEIHQIPKPKFGRALDAWSRESAEKDMDSDSISEDEGTTTGWRRATVPSDRPIGMI